MTFKYYFLICDRYNNDITSFFIIHYIKNNVILSILLLYFLYLIQLLNIIILDPLTMKIDFLIWTNIFEFIKYKIIHYINKTFNNKNILNISFIVLIFINFY